ncbi:VOC family protein [Pseudogracilibacillus sp. SO30301A]|uniref:VOC family protein n=1 Tax=Pseudogracilibacillus sp. SO30301A TaxID=3098291 RepID=UPI00300DD77D
MAGTKVTQIGVVVRDLNKALEEYYETFGWGPWSVYELKKPRHHNTELYGEQVEYTSRIAETRVGDIDFELIEPLDGPSIYKEHLDKYGEGLHHIACMGDGLNFEETFNKFRELGFEKTMSGSIDDSINYYYLNTESRLKIIVESGSGHARSLKPDWVYPEKMERSCKATITQIGVVVKDIKESLKEYSEVLGWKPWNVYELKSPRHHGTKLHGKEEFYTSVIAEIDLGNIDFELIEPKEGPSIYKEYLEEYGEGLHHLACMGTGDNHEEIFKVFEEKGYEKTMSGKIDESIEYYYLNTESRLKVIFESGSGHARSLKPDWVYPKS